MFNPDLTYVGEEPGEGDDEPTFVQGSHDDILRLDLLDVSHFAVYFHLVLQQERLCQCNRQRRKRILSVKDKKWKGRKFSALLKDIVLDLHLLTPLLPHARIQDHPIDVSA